MKSRPIRPHFETDRLTDRDRYKKKKKRELTQIQGTII